MTVGTQLSMVLGEVGETRCSVCQSKRDKYPKSGNRQKRIKSSEVCPDIHPLDFSPHTVYIISELNESYCEHCKRNYFHWVEVEKCCDGVMCGYRCLNAKMPT